ncbi:MAG: MFS transporter [Fulvivirga sp.]
MAESDANINGMWNKSLPYVIFAGCIVILIIFIQKYVIETKGKSLEELEGIWAEKYGEIKS